nr:uncharacterized protein C1orf141 homolog isoform X2 [Camelus dromedarius]
MAEKILEKLDILDEQAKAFLAIRAKKNNLQGQVRKKISVIPLTFDFQLEFEKAIATPISKTESKITKDRSHGINKTKRYSSFKNKPEPKKPNLRPHVVPTNIKIQEIKSIEPIEESLKSRPIRSFRYLKDTTEMENAKPLHELHLQHKQQQCRRTLGSTIISSVSSIQPNAYKEEKDSVKRIKSSQMNDFSAKENESIISDQLNEYSARKRSSLPLCFEDELERPNAKIISICPAKTATSHMKNYVYSTEERCTSNAF